MGINCLPIETRNHSFIDVLFYKTPTNKENLNFSENISWDEFKIQSDRVSCQDNSHGLSPCHLKSR